VSGVVGRYSPHLFIKPHLSALFPTKYPPTCTYKFIRNFRTDLKSKNGMADKDEEEERGSTFYDQEDTCTSALCLVLLSVR
jgi:hypothetical protein